MAQCTWKKNVIYKTPQGNKRYELKCGSKFTIDIFEDKRQGFAGSNQVNVYVKEYGGWSLGTPKNFQKKKDANKFVSIAKKKLMKGEYGKQVAFPR